ncbi:MAG TPA: hypothetical protein VFZ67_00150 [Nitrososphaera sp.]
MKNTRNIAVVAAAVAILFSFATVTRQQMAAAQMTFDEWCGAICDVQEEFNQNLEEAREEEEREQTAELSGEEENVSAVDKFIAEIEEEGEFDDQREAEEQEENGIEDAKNMLSARVLRDYAKTILLNQTFTRLLNNASETTAPDIDEVEEEIDTDEVAQRQIITYEFNEDTSEDDIRIYTVPEETVQILANTIATIMNETDIELFANGRMIITHDGESSFDEADDTRIYAPHNYTVVNGYRYANSTIYDQNSIEIFADPPTATTIPGIPTSPTTTTARLL